MKNLSSCPNCGAIWSPGSEEYDWQQCDACGWTHGDPIDDDDVWDDIDDDWDDDEEDDCEGGKITIDKELFDQFIEVVQTNQKFNLKS